MHLLNYTQKLKFFYNYIIFDYFRLEMSQYCEGIWIVYGPMNQSNQREWETTKKCVISLIRKKSPSVRISHMQIRISSYIQYWLKSNYPILNCSHAAVDKSLENLNFRGVLIPHKKSISNVWALIKTKYQWLKS